MSQQKENIYIIPDFQPSEIISYFLENNISITKNEIIKPTCHSNLRIYSSILNFINGFSINKVEESKFILLVYKKMHILLKKLGTDSFDLKDLLSPVYKKHLNYLSTIYNFCIYKDSKKEFYEKLMA